jgi:pimeloyl-ACP methyl ester carboxylesterase
MEGAEEMARNIPNARLHVFERSGHMVFMEEPEELVTVLKEWITAIGK